MDKGEIRGRSADEDDELREAERLRQMLPRAFIIGAGIFPGFLVLELPALVHDYPEVTWTWPVVWRLFGSLVFLVGALVVERRKMPLRPLVGLAATVIALTAAAAGCVSWKLGGFDSDVSQGMAFYFVGIATLISAPLKLSLAMMLPTYFAYFGMLTLLEGISTGTLLPDRSFVYDCMLQLGICLFAAAGAHILWTSRQQLYRARRLGRYRLDSLVRRGAVSEVWRATEQLKGHASRAVALKIVRAERTFDRDLQNRFEREARAVSALGSEHTIRIYDYGASDDGLAFLAMEPLDGVDLESLVTTSGPIEPRRAVHFAKQVALSLIEAHRRGMVHGDVKPSNLFVLDQAGKEDQLKVLDWGIARGFAWRTPTVTHQAMSVGTPALMAPEAFTGTSSPRGDVYAFGASLYWLLTASYPVSFAPGEGPWSAHSRATVQAPSIVRNQLFPAGLDMLVLPCLAKAPEQRPADMGVVLQALRSLPAEPWSADDAARAWVARRPAAAGQDEAASAAVRGQRSPDSA